MHDNSTVHVLYELLFELVANEEGVPKLTINICFGAAEKGDKKVRTRICIRYMEI